MGLTTTKDTINKFYEKLLGEKHKRQIFIFVMSTLNICALIVYFLIETW
jgi:hypothetical protein